MKKILLLFSLLLIGFTNVFATHNRAGEITYTHISGMTYGITVTTYTNTNPATTSADRCELTVIFWSGSHLIDSIIVPRVNGVSNKCSYPNHDGEDIDQLLGISLYPFTNKNIYYGTFTFGGPGTYRMTMDDMNRNAGTCNINNGNSVNTSFSLVSELVINPFLGANDSPVLLNLPLDQACVGVCFKHNPGAYDPNGDSLSYSLIPCADNHGIGIPGWIFPPNMSANDINVYKGDIVWCAPNQVCNYNIAILIKQYRRLSGSPIRYYIGSVVRDMQISVQSCANNPPVIAPIDDTCIVAGTNLHFNVTATDAQYDVVTLEGNGGPFHITPPATFSSSPTLTPVHGTFNWTPACSEIQLLPYLVTFKATDSDPTTPLVDYKSVFIRVIAPAPTGLTATPTGASIILHWNAVTCHDTVGANPLIGYHVYRKNSCDPFVHNTCETGLPPTTGYTLLANTGPNITNFTDNNNGSGLVNGFTYSYIIVAYYSDGSQSYASTNVCAMLVRDIPIITNVSVMTTDPHIGTMWVHWIKPLATPPNLDTVVNPPPYQYRLMRAQGMSGSLTFSEISPIGSYIYNSFSQLPDTGFVDTGLNTLDSAYTYRVDFYANGILVGSTNTASSVYLNSTPAGNRINLSWQAAVPWSNYKYYIYKPNPHGSQNFVLYDSTFNMYYVDSNLVNGQSYCYKIRSVGQFTDTSIPHPLFNMSEIRCDTPVDKVPPCQPKFLVNNDCGIYQNVLTWTNPNTYCCHDAVQYNIYFAPTSDTALVLIYSTTNMNDTTYTHIFNYDGVASTAGCYAVTALDTVGNESPIVTKLCVDNCPDYQLPNVFTPNGDGINDMVTPLPGYRYIKDVDMKIYDRWGLIMFSTSDRDILWDGKNSATKMMCPDGVYFYVCTVNEIHVDGIKPTVLKGFIQLLKESPVPKH